MLGNRVVGVLRESGSKWERRAPLTPSHCARLLHSVGRVDGVDRIIVQPCTKRIHPDAQYEDVGCEISEDLSDCGLILGIKQPKLENILPDRAYAFFSHSHKAQPENMPLLDKVLSQRVSLYDYELIVGENGKRLLAFGTYAGRTGMIDFLRGLGERFLNLGYSTPFLSLGSSYMYSSLSAAKAAVIAVGEEISTSGLPSAISPLVFVFTGSGNVSQGAQEILRLLPHTFVDPSELHKLVESTKNVPNSSKGSKFSRQNFQVFACVVTSKDMVAPKDPAKHFDKDDYYAHPELYYPVFHEKIAPYATCIVNCMYWEKRFPRLLTNKQMKELKLNLNRLVGVADITCDIGGSIECLKRATPIECPFFRYDPLTGSYHEDMNGEGVIFLAVDNLPTEVAKEATKHFGDVLSQFLGSMASSKGPEDLLPPIRKACIAHKGELTTLYGYIKRMREEAANHSDNASAGKTYKTSVSLNGHLFDQFLINEALDIIEAAGGSFHLARCELGQTSDAMTYAEIEVSANDKDLLAHIVDLLAAVANSDNERINWGVENEIKESSVRNRESKDNSLQMKESSNEKFAVLILGAGHVSKPAIEFLALNGCNYYESQNSRIRETSREAVNNIQVIVASLYLQDAQKVIEGIPNTTAVEIDVNDHNHLLQYISEVDVVISLLPASCHTPIAHACIELKKHLVTASYVDKNMSDANERAKSAGVTILCEMGLDPGIDHMMAMKMINQAHFRGGKIKSFVSYCGGLPSPADANNPLGYKFSWSPAGALRAGRNPAVYISEGQTIMVAGEDLYDSATCFRLPHLPAFALERIPNRDSLVYGDLYGITNEASSIFRATLRYEGFSEIMSALAKLGYFNNEIRPMLTQGRGVNHSTPSFNMFLQELLREALKNNQTQKDVTEAGHSTEQMDIANILVRVGCCKSSMSANKVAFCIRYLGLDDESKIPEACKSAFDIICSRMEERLKYFPNEQDMVLLHHEVQVTYDDGRPSELHKATLLEFGKNENDKSESAMARTVGIPAAIGAQLLLEGKITSTGVLRPLDPEIYLPALEILKASGIHMHEEVESI